MGEHAETELTLSGIADEAGDSMVRQIQAHQALGWQTIELRTVEGQNVCGALNQDAFDDVVRQVQAAGLKVTAFASAIGNWSRPIQGDFQLDVDELKTAAPRMRQLGVQHIRTMSWVGDNISEADWRRETIRRYRELTRIAEGEGVVLAHENCTGWAGLGPAQMRELIETIDSEHLVVLFDIGNTISHGYEPWDYYQGVRDLIRYVHVKDCRWAPDRGRSQAYVYPGQGDAMVLPILTDLIAGGYRGVVSIEPHVAKVIHHADSKPNDAAMYDAYLRYGRTFVDLVEQAKQAVNA